MEEFVAIAEAEVLRDFKKESDDELTIHKGDIVAILDEDRESKMCLCENDGRAGWIPSDYLYMEEEKV